MNKFNLSQFGCKIQYLINLQLNRKNLDVFSYYNHSKEHKPNFVINSHFSVIFLTSCTFSYSHPFLINFIDEKNERQWRKVGGTI